MSAMALSDMSKWKHSRHKCPACGRSLWTLPVLGGRLYFCVFDPCQSFEAKEGAQGASGQEAISNLKKLIDAEPELPSEQEYPEFPLKNGRRLKWKD